MNTCKACGERLTAFSPKYNQCTNKTCNSIYKRPEAELDREILDELEHQRAWEERYSGGYKL